MAHSRCSLNDCPICPRWLRCPHLHGCSGTEAETQEDLSISQASWVPQGPRYEVGPKGSPTVAGVPQLWPQILNKRLSVTSIPIRALHHPRPPTPTWEVPLWPQNINRQRELETNCKIYSRAAGAGEILKGTSCFGAVGLWPWQGHTSQWAGAGTKTGQWKAGEHGCPVTSHWAGSAQAAVAT